MVDNRIRVKLAEHKMSAAALSEKIPDMGKVCMSFIVNGLAMPTRDGMTAMCETFDCLATDLYDEAELNLNVTGRHGQQPAESPLHISKGETATINAAAPVRHERNDGHAGQERVFFWFKPEEKAALVKAVKGLGYRSTTEWMREMYRHTIKQYAMLGLEGKTLHDLIPPIAKQINQGTDKS